ncbi:Dynein heavy chain 3, axonemal [Halocaridina rubra]|uniref:Dynein heavy chain 3, axonemal n=1 Tax=Halocaridina rubra TaxID=373956 RepID=A0AAN8XMG8_HALRR
MSVMFETSDLEQASPATVSRCGMVFMENKQLGWRPLKDSYIATLPEAITDAVKENLEEVIEWMLPPVFDFVRKKCKFMIDTSELHLFQSFSRLLDSLLDEVRDAGKPLGAKISDDKLICLLQSLITFVVPWTIGSTITGTSRRLFDQYFRSLLAGKMDKYPKPDCFKLTRA